MLHLPGLSYLPGLRALSYLPGLRALSYLPGLRARLSAYFGRADPSAKLYSFHAVDGLDLAAHPENQLPALDLLSFSFRLSFVATSSQVPGLPCGCFRVGTHFHNLPSVRRGWCRSSQGFLLLKVRVVEKTVVCHLLELQQGRPQPRVASSRRSRRPTASLGLPRPRKYPSRAPTPPGAASVCGAAWAWAWPAFRAAAGSGRERTGAVNGAGRGLGPPCLRVGVDFFAGARIRCGSVAVGAAGRRGVPGTEPTQ